jgi:outer membrane protein
MLVRRGIAAAAVIGLLLVGGRALADEPLKFAVIDMQKALNDSKAGKKAIDELDRYMESRRPELQKQKDAIQKKRDELDKQGLLLNEDTRKARENEIRTMERDLSRAVSDLQDEIKRRQAELSDTVQKDLARIVEKMGKEGGYSLILIKQPQIVLYSLPASDLTEALIKRYDAEGGK